MAKSKYDKEKSEIEKFEKASEVTPEVTKEVTKEVAPEVVKVEVVESKIPKRPQVKDKPLGVGTFMDLVAEVAWLKVRVEALEKD